MTPALERFLSNRLLARLPAEELTELVPDLTRVDVPRGRTLQELDELPGYLYFPASGMSSVVVELSAGVSVEVGMIGVEGAVNSGAVRYPGLSPVRIFGQVPGEAFQLPLSLVRSPSAFPMLHFECARHAEFLYAMAAQSAACNRQHELDNRLARWLLGVADHTHQEDFPLTQEFIAEMLGVRRPTVTVAAQALARAGLILYRRGVVSLLDRSGLERRACECYAVLKGRLARLNGADILPPSPNEPAPSRRHE